MKHKTKERNKESRVLTGSAENKEQEKPRLEKFPEVFRLSSETSSYCTFHDLCHRKEMPFFHHASSLNKIIFEKNQEELALWFLQNHRTLLLKGTWANIYIQAPTQSLNVFWCIWMNPATSSKWLDSLGYRKGLPSLSQTAHPTPASSGLSSGVKQYKPIPSSAWQADKFYNSSPVSLSVLGHQAPVLQTTLNRTRFPDPGHTVSTPHHWKPSDSATLLLKWNVWSPALESLTWSTKGPLCPGSWSLTCIKSAKHS